MNGRTPLCAYTMSAIDQFDINRLVRIGINRALPGSVDTGIPTSIDHIGACAAQCHGVRGAINRLVGHAHLLHHNRCVRIIGLERDGQRHVAVSGNREGKNQLICICDKRQRQFALKYMEGKIARGIGNGGIKRRAIELRDHSDP